MTKKELINFYNALQSLGSIRGVKFAYAVSKNLNLLDSEKKSLDKAIEKSETFVKLEEEFEAERIKIAEKYSNKDDKGIPIKKFIPINNQMVEIYDLTPENQKTNNQEAEIALKAKNPELYNQRNKQIADYDNLLKEEVSIAFFPFMVKLSDIPQDISASQMNSIFAMVTTD